MAEEKKPHIAVSYYAPTFDVGGRDEKCLYVIKQIRWSVNLKNEDHVYLCSVTTDGTKRREICCLKQRDDRQFWGLLYSPFSHMEISLSASLGVLGTDWGEGEEHILLFSLDGKTIQRLSCPAWESQGRPWRVGCPTVSPDGKWIAFVELTCPKGPGGACYRRLAKCHPDGSEYTVLTKFDGYRNDVQPAWSPDGDSIADIRPDNDEMRVMDVDGNIKWTLHAFHVHNPHWSPDGKFILLGAVDDGVLADVSSKKVIKKCEPPLRDGAKWGKDGYLVPQRDEVDFVEPDANTVHRLLQNVSRPAKHADLNREEFRW